MTKWRVMARLARESALLIEQHPTAAVAICKVLAGLFTEAENEDDLARERNKPQFGNGGY